MQARVGRGGDFKKEKLDGIQLKITQ